MSRHRKKRSSKVAPAAPLVPTDAQPKAILASPFKVWSLRLLLLVLAPVIVLACLELGLRFAGFGYSTSFLLPAIISGKQVLTQNDRFGWRFFGPNLAREPFPFAIPASKPANTVRIFVFGESAAYGDPQPEFGLARMLEAMLGLRYPGVRFEIVNAAMTGINSHVALPIARDCSAAQGDLWVVYMGNNEVVGPFGAGTVFGPQAPSPSLIRTTLALKSTRTGQLLDWLVQRLHPPPVNKSEWGGMLMFLEHRVRQDDPRMERVYKNFERNLAQILELGRTSRAGIVVGTVAVNLKDCAPFASLPRSSLSANDSANWAEMFRRGVAAQKAGQQQEALGYFQHAEQLDDSVAELQFAIAQSCLTMGKNAEAQRRFMLARDLDALRFRCDTRLNDITRRLCTNREPIGIRLADAEKVLAQQSPDGIPGAQFFYDHVHLNFDGNYQLALVFAQQLTKLLPENIRQRAAPQSPWPSAEDCARRLGWTELEQLTAVEEMLGRLSDPPFTAQLNHNDQMDRLGRLDDQLRSHAQAELYQAIVSFQEALKASPEDPILYKELARTFALIGQLREAADAAKHVTELLPNAGASWMLLGEMLSQDRKFPEAVRGFQEAARFDSESAWAHYNLGLSYEKLGRHKDAVQEYQYALRIKPRLGPAWLALGQLLEQEGNKQEAERDYRQAVKNRVLQPKELALLAQFCQNRGWFAEAATNYLDALRLRPGDPLLHMKAGQSLERLGRLAEAKRHYTEAVRLAPDSGQPHFLLGLILGRQGKPVEAAEQFAEAVRLMPEVIEARVNLGIALLDQGRKVEALAQFQQVLLRSPTNEVALRNVSALEAR